MATAVFGSISEFCSETEHFTEWVERLEQWFLANVINDTDRQRALFLSFIGAKGYKLIRSLAQNEPSKKTYDELKKLMKEHLQPKPNEISQRYVFYKRDRRMGESIKDYVAELRKLSEHCNFGDRLDESLRDKLVCGLNNEKIQQKLLAIRDLNLQKVIDTSVAIEAAARSAKELGGSSSGGEFSLGSAIHKLESEKSMHVLRRECYRCGNSRHLADSCPFKNKECYGCKQTGHIRKKCLNGRNIKRGNGYSSGTRKVNQASVELDSTDRVDEEEVSSSMNFLTLYALEAENRRYDPVLVKLQLNGNEVEMEVDTGAAVTVMSSSCYDKLQGEKLKTSDLRLKTYTGQVVRPRGIGELDVVYKNQKFRLPIVVLEGKVPSLLGRDWLSMIKLRWNDLFAVSINNVDAVDVDERVEEVRKKYPGVFSDTLGCLKDFEVHIPVPNDVKPIYFKPRSVPYALRSRVDDELDKLERQGIWKKVEYSRWAAPIVPVLKNSRVVDGPVRICGDYKVTVNKVAPCDNYPIPNTSEQLATLAGGQKFSKIDLSQAYQQLKLDQPTQELLTISTHRGLYQPNRLQFGVHSATGIFQREMDKRLTGIPFVKVRVDDILVSGRSDEEHLENLEKVLERLEEAELTVNLSKCYFLQHEVTYCGYRISKEGVRPLTQNVEAVKNAPEPTNVSELRSYLGMLNYYQNYLPALATRSEPLHLLLRKGNEWKWGEHQAKAFKETKAMLSEAPLLVHFDPSLPIIVHADASPYGVGAVLSHIMPDGSERPVCFASRTLAQAERNYGHIEKEGLALVFAVKKFHHYLYGHKFTMVTDHKPLLGLFAEDKGFPDRAAARILRWALLLSAYNYKLEYRPGVSHCNADGLSRLPLQAKAEDLTEVGAPVHMMELVNSPVTEVEVRNQTRREPVLAAVLDQVLNGWKNETGSVEELKPYYIRRGELSTEGGCILWGNRVIIPRMLRERVLSELHEVHMGSSRMKALARSFVWWPGMDKDIEGRVRHCSSCQSNQSKPATAPVHSWQYPASPWERIHVDFAGPFMGKMFLVVVDAYSKWIEVEALNSSTSAATVRCLRRIYAMHGLPQVLVSDNGPAFIGQEFKDFLKRNGVRHILTAPYHPASNGQAERMVRTFKESMKALHRGDLDAKLSRLLFKYRITPHSVTGSTPAELLFKRQLRSAFHLLKPSQQTRAAGQQWKVEEYSNCKTNTRVFEKGDLVWVRNFGNGDKWLKGSVFRRTGAVNYEVLLDEVETWVPRHIDHLLKRTEGSTVEVSEVDISESTFSTPVEVGEADEEVAPLEVEVTDHEGSEKNHDEPAVEESKVVDTPVVRRSGRISRKPGWMTEEFVEK